MKMVKLLVKNVNVNVKNLNGLTAMDIFHLQGSLQNTEIGTIATTTYEAGLSPPGGYWQDDYKPPAANNDTITSLGQEQEQRPHRAGQMIMSPTNLFYFLTFNGLAFYLSVWTILVTIIGLTFSGAVYTSTSLLLYAYYASMVATFPTQGSEGLIAARALYIALTLASTLAAYLIPWMTFPKHRNLKRRVDTMRGSKVLASSEN
ncbi:hypothetical protein V6N13_076923 [Hibiscus sabdariffa]